MAQVQAPDLNLICWTRERYGLTPGETLAILNLYGYLQDLAFNQDVHQFNQSDYARVTGLSRTTIRSYLSSLMSMDFAEFTRSRDFTRFALKPIPLPENFEYFFPQEAA